jgi:hypothetical protein
MDVVPTLRPSEKPPKILINELLTRPNSVDSNADQWIELHNPGKQAVNLSGWRLDTGRNSARVYRIPSGTVINAGGYLVFYGADTGLILPQGKGQVRLTDPRGRIVVDAVAYPALVTGQSYARDAAGHWHSDWAPTPGSLNAAQPKTVIPRGLLLDQMDYWYNPPD